MARKSRAVPEFALIIDVQPGDRKVTVTGSVLHNGRPVPIDWPIVIVNPPEMVPAGSGGCRRDPDEAIRQVVLEVARGLVEE